RPQRDRGARPATLPSRPRPVRRPDPRRTGPRARDDQHRRTRVPLSGRAPPSRRRQPPLPTELTGLFGGAACIAPGDFSAASLLDARARAFVVWLRSRPYPPLRPGALFHLS